MRDLTLVRDIYGVRNLVIFSIILTNDNDVKKMRMGDENRGISFNNPQISYPTNMSPKVTQSEILTGVKIFLTYAALALTPGIQ